MADELKRRLVHASGSGLVALYLLANYLEVGLTWQYFRVLMVVLAVGAIGLEFLRLRVGLEWWLYDKLTREYEQDQFAGYGYYMLSMTIVVVVFQPAIALPAMLMLALGDPISGAVSDDSLRRVKSPKCSPRCSSSRERSPRRFSRTRPLSWPQRWVRPSPTESRYGSATSSSTTT